MLVDVNEGGWGGGGGGVIALQSTIFQKLFQNALDPLSTAHKI